GLGPPASSACGSRSARPRPCARGSRADRRRWPPAPEPDRSRCERPAGPAATGSSSSPPRQAGEAPAPSARSPWRAELGRRSRERLGEDADGVDRLARVAAELDALDHAAFGQIDEVQPRRPLAADDVEAVLEPGEPVGEGALAGDRDRETLP